MILILSFIEVVAILNVDSCTCTQHRSGWSVGVRINLAQYPGTCRPRSDNRALCHSISLELYPSHPGSSSASTSITSSSIAGSANLYQCETSHLPNNHQLTCLIARYSLCMTTRALSHVQPSKIETNFTDVRSALKCGEWQAKIDVIRRECLAFWP